MKKYFPLYINILTVFTSLTFLIVFCVVTYGYVRNADIALLSAEQLIRQTGSSIGERTQNIFDTAFMNVNTCTAFPELGDKPSIHSHPMTSVFFKYLQENPDFTSVYVGFGDGDFYLVSSLRGRELMKKERHIPDNAAWYTQTIGHLGNGSRYELIKYLDTGFVTVGSSSSLDVKYDPCIRPWFQAASVSDQPVLNDVYIFAFSGEPGLTVSRRFDGKVPGVVGIDISLANLADFMERQMVGADCEIMIYGSNGKLYGYHSQEKLTAAIHRKEDSSISEVSVAGLKNKVLDLIVETYEGHGDDELRIQNLLVDGKKYISLVDPLPSEYGKELFVAVAVPESFFTGPIARIGQKTLLVSVGILLLFVPIIYYVAKRLSRPLNELTRSVEKIRKFELDSPVQVHSNIVEIRDLSLATETMRSTLNAFGSYIPRPLVESMIVNRIVPKLGGERKKLTFLFSDIKDFTSIAETLSPEELTSSITNYFTMMSQIILFSGGTIDKYIGDAIMAFWNAPVEDADHVRKACLAALRCRDEIKRFNSRCRECSEPEMITRLGVHTGEAVVGNIGSSDRMDYTAIGAAVNVASRLEGLNKFLGTEILVSENTAKESGDGFLFRFAGRVMPKGTTVSLGVYELLGTSCGSVGELAEFAVSSEEEERAASWEYAFNILLSHRYAEAVTAFDLHCGRFGDDPLCGYYLDMARRFMTQSDNVCWTGEVVFDAK
ncbi:adenylate/guanylate cyclase domain-containing protein [Maridesulfovibrio sp. FT414]|uniref:adenylate/guanylate cyclase domain-containing protein n=1 Tax=Maridesulfovibrio sp. FT414 TaxID=2979469 RepID=UPI003D802C10